MFCQHINKTGILTEDIPESFFLKALADCSRGALLLFQKVQLLVLYQLMINHCMPLLSLTNRVCNSKFRYQLSSGWGLVQLWSVVLCSSMCVVRDGRATRGLCRHPVPPLYPPLLDCTAWRYLLCSIYTMANVPLIPWTLKALVFLCISKFFFNILMVHGWAILAFYYWHLSRIDSAT